MFMFTRLVIIIIILIARDTFIKLLDIFICYVKRAVTIQSGQQMPLETGQVL